MPGVTYDLDDTRLCVSSVTYPTVDALPARFCVTYP